MFGSRRGGGDDSVTCIACGETLPRSDAREYDKEGDRWDRRDKEFEYLCKDCYGDLCHQPRDDLESLLETVESTTDDSVSSEDFAIAYQDAAAERHGEREDVGADAGADAGADTNADTDADTDTDRRR
ncbi:MAG: hypothetical protein ABEI99_02010 [Halobaculum sp.]